MEDNVQRIKSFQVDHRTLREGIYISRTDKGIVTYDMRTRRPNAGEYMDNVTVHTFEHMFATYIRNSEISEDVIYFGPMGCQTGFYLLVSERIPPQRVYEVCVEVLGRIVAHSGAVFGASEAECGNYRSLELGAAQREAERYLEVLKSCPEPSFRYE